MSSLPLTFHPHEGDPPPCPVFVRPCPPCSPAQTCREVVRDASGRIVQTIDRQKSAGGTVQATTRDASGRIIGTATTNPNAGGSSQTTYRDASGRLTGTASTQPTTGASSRTTYRDASGRIDGQRRHPDWQRLRQQHPVPRRLGTAHWQLSHQRQFVGIIHRHPARCLRPADRQQHGQREMPRRRGGSCSGAGSRRSRHADQKSTCLTRIGKLR